MKKISNYERSKGELLIRELSEKAQQAYYETDPLIVAVTLDGTISVRGCYGDYDDLTKEELEEMFESYADSECIV